MLCVHGGQTISVRSGRENRAGEGDFPLAQPSLLSREHFPAMTPVKVGGGSREFLLPVAFQNNLYPLECRKPVLFIL